MLRKTLFLVLFAALYFVVSSTVFAAKSLTIFWAEWDPADFLQELVLDFEKETGIKVNVDSTPWGDFQTKTFQEFAAKGDAFDMVIGDSQWLGAGATAGHYVDITDWFIKNKVDKTMAPATIACYAEYPAGSKKYYAVPCEADAFGWAYRKDWFEDPKEKEAFKKKYGYELGVPETWAQLRDIAEFFYRPKEGRYGCGIWTERGYDAITMGFENVFFSWGADFGDRQTYEVEGVVNSKKAVEALEFYKELYKFCPPDWGNTWFQQANQGLTEGLVAMTQNFYAFFPALTNPRINKHADVTGFFPNPKGPYGDRHAALGGQGISINAYSKKRDLCFKFLEWFIRDDIQKKWGELGGFPASSKVLLSKEFQKATEFNNAFSTSMFMVKDFWNIPHYAELLEIFQRISHQYLVEDKGTAKEALDMIAKKHTELLKKEGYIKK